MAVEGALCLLSQFFTDARFPSAGFDLSLSADLILTILGFSLSPAALQVVTTAVKENPSVHDDNHICTAVQTLLQSHGAQVDFSDLTGAFLELAPFPPDWLIGVFCSYNQQILDGVFHHSIPSALAYFSLCAERFGLTACANYGVDIYSLAAKVPGWLQSSSRRLIGASISFLAAIQTCDEATCDFLIDLMRRKQEAADESESARISKNGLLCRTVHLFMVRRQQLCPKFPEILDFLTMLLPHPSHAIEFTLIAGILDFLEAPSFSPELCDLLLEFYDRPLVTVRIFYLLIDWVEHADLESLGQLAKMIFERGDELADFLDESDLPEHKLFRVYLPALEKCAAAKQIQSV
jgi:hypothetical protein